ncbi:MAG: hypothetical protein IPL61_00885 [Myxococcales bacterium]|nr:hypothetical protein [Myxococcales bacterium]
MFTRLVVVGVLLGSTGCYFEGTAAYHPRISQAVTDPNTPSTTETGGGWSAGVNIGFYFEARLRSRTLRGFGIGASPSSFNGYGIAPSAPTVKAATKSNTFRADLVLPTQLLSPYIHERLTFSYAWLRDTSMTIAPDTMAAMSKASDGRMWFLGGSLGYRLPVRNGDRLGHFVFVLSAGIERFRADLTTDDDRRLHVSSTGLGVRLMIVPAMIGSARPGPYENLPTRGDRPKSNAGCYYTDDPTTGKPVYRCM